MVKLSDGREIEIDLYKLTLEEYRALFNTAQKPEDEDVILARVFGLDVEDYRKLPYPDWRRLTVAFFDAARNPLASPNSLSESTSTSDTGTDPRGS